MYRGRPSWRCPWERAFQLGQGEGPIGLVGPISQPLGTIGTASLTLDHTYAPAQLQVTSLELCIYIALLVMNIKEMKGDTLLELSAFFCFILLNKKGHIPGFPILSSSKISHRLITHQGRCPIFPRALPESIHI